LSQISLQLEGSPGDPKEAALAQSLKSWQVKFCAQTDKSAASVAKAAIATKVLRQARFWCKFAMVDLLS
jgi:hypothetical protein